MQALYHLNYSASSKLFLIEVYIAYTDHCVCVCITVIEWNFC
jgi:hypothetical protein